MRRGAAYLLVVAATLATTSCAGTRQVAVRPLGARFATTAPVSTRVSEGLGHLAIGDAGLALESFRRALADEPDNVAALRGIGAAYDMMGRSDLSQRMYEQALALAPRDTVTLTALAGSLSGQGRDHQATLVRREMASVGAISAPASSVTIALAPAAPAPEKFATATPLPAPVSAPQSQGPHLERMSLGEVALVTLPSRIALARAAPARIRVASLIPQRTPQPAIISIRLINAARREGLAASTRLWLEQRGWRRIAIGTAPKAVALGHLLYPAGREQTGRRLASQFGIAALRGPADQQAIIVILGQNAIANRARTTRG